MANTAQLLKNLVPITQFNRGKAASIFERVKRERHLIVLKNNEPSAIILSPEEYARLAEIEEDYYLMTIAGERLAKGEALPFEAVLREAGITQDDLDAMGDVEIE